MEPQLKKEKLEESRERSGGVWLFETESVGFFIVMGVEEGEESLQNKDDPFGVNKTQALLPSLNF
ncbi:conserved hypothetical protein [Ricinus communis]|uniref:Uncharacterized protein n=1 Tax=Ricinus communis TaxID=3988 RepID=B9RFW2_RICCO|nr:conserved hypothetical protein [Ricinus communis]